MAAKPERVPDPTVDAQTLVRIVAPHFVAGFIVEDGHVVHAAPIVKYMALERWSADRARAYIKHKSWKASIIREATR